VNLEELIKEKLWIRPKSVKHFVQAVATYLFFLILALVFFYLCIKDPDIVTQVFTVVVLLFYVFTHFLMLTVGQTTVKLKDKNKHQSKVEYGGKSY